MDPISILLIVAAVVSAGFGIVLLYHGGTGRVARVYAINILAIMGWVGTMYFYRTAEAETVVFWTRALYIAASTIASTFFYFTFIFPRPERFSFLKIGVPIVVCNAVVALLVAYTDFIIADASVRGIGENAIVFGRLYAFYIAYILFFFLYGFWRIFRKLRTTSDTTERAQIWYLLVGYAIGANISFATNLLAPWFGYFTFNWVGQLTSILMIVFTTYAIVKHHLFDVRIITTEFLTFLVWVFLLTRTVLAETQRDQIIDGVVFLLTFVFGIFLIKSVIREVKAREEIERLAEDLEKANKRLKELDQLKSEFLSIASHQMRSPLTAIKGYASLILEGSYGSIAAGAREAIDHIFKSVETMIKTVENFLNVSRIEQGRMSYDLSEQDVSALVKEVVDELLPVAVERRLSLSFSTDRGPHRARIDADKLKQVFVNLVDNALKYTPHGSVRVGVVRVGNLIRVSVSDTGVGMDTKDLARLFKKFSRANDAYETNVRGTGLGLYVAREIVEAHKGRIVAESAGKGKGSVFTVELTAFSG